MDPGNAPVDDVDLFDLPSLAEAFDAYGEPGSLFEHVLGLPQVPGLGDRHGEPFDIDCELFRLPPVRQAFHAHGEHAEVPDGLRTVPQVPVMGHGNAPFDDVDLFDLSHVAKAVISREQPGGVPEYLLDMPQVPDVGRYLVHAYLDDCKLPVVSPGKVPGPA